MNDTVIIYLRLSDDGFGMLAEREAMLALGDALEQAVTAKDVGMLDGNEFGEGRCALFFFGPEADPLYEAMEPILRKSSVAHGGSVTKVYCKGDDENRVEFDLDF